MPRTVCLLLACNYEGSSCELSGCVNDAENLSEYLVGNGLAKREDITLIREPTRAQIEGGLEDLANATHHDDVSDVFVSFSGHGTQVWDYSGDEEDGRDECLCPSDFQKSGLIRDDELNRYFERMSHTVRVSVLIDACHSATCVDLPHVYVGHQRTRASTRASGPCHPDMMMISGCKDSQTSADLYDRNRNEYTGAMTSAFLDVLRLEPTLVQDAFSIVCAMRVLLWERRMTQVPQLSTSTALGCECRAFLRD